MLPIDLDGMMQKLGILSKQFEIFEWTYVECGLSGDLPKNFHELTVVGYLAKRPN